MITYEVNAQFDQALKTEYLAWLKEHVRQVVALDGFIDATVESLEEDERLLPGKSGICVRYRLLNHRVLESYLVEHAPALRSDGLKRFGERVIIYRLQGAGWRNFQCWALMLVIQVISYFYQTSLPSGSRKGCR